MTASATTQSSQTTHIVVDSKWPAFAGNFVVLIPAFPVSVRLRGLLGRFWPPVSRRGSAVPGGRILRTHDGVAVRKSEILGVGKRRLPAQVIGGLVRALRTEVPTQRRDRGVARYRCLVAGGLRWRL